MHGAAAIGASVIESAADVSRDWLDTVLRDAGALTSGGVDGFRIVDDGAADNSRSVSIDIDYARGSRGELPRRLFLKLCRSPAFDRSEVDYYTRDYLALADPPMPRCYHAAHAPGRYHLLLRDVAGSHVPSWDHVASPRHAAGLARSLAALHAHAWGARRIAACGYRVPGIAEFSLCVERAQRGVAPMAAALPPGPERDWLARASAWLPRLAQRQARRAQDPAGIALLHGDTNPGNVLVPHADGTVLLIDRQPFAWSLRCWLGVSDLAHALVLWRDVADRRAIERGVLQAYHAALRARGIDDYPFAQLLDDYRLCLLEPLLVALGWCIDDGDRERMRWLWELELRRVIAALEDHDVASLWR